jgi:DNA-binding NarL/FixJ family response regulator
MRFHSRIVHEPCEVRPSDDVVLFYGPRMGPELRRFSIEANGGLPPLAVLATCFDWDDVCLALDSGAIGYLLEIENPDLLAAALHCISHGHTILAPQVAAERARVASRTAGAPRQAPTLPTTDTTGDRAGDRDRGGNASPPLALSPQEREIMTRLASGLSVREVAVEMRLAEKTVRNYLSHIYGKLGVRGRSQALLRWLGHGGVPPER